jgi:hypothetical protein
MRPARILLLAVALLAAALTGWALGARDDNTRPGAAAATQAPPEAAAPNDPAPQDLAADGTTPSGNPAATTPPAPRPRIFGFGSEPVLPEKDGVWQLQSSAGILSLTTNAEHATKVEFLTAPTGADRGDAVRIGRVKVDPVGNDFGYSLNWHYHYEKDEPLVDDLIVRATGPRRHRREVRRHLPPRPDRALLNRPEPAPRAAQPPRPGGVGTAQVLVDELGGDGALADPVDRWRTSPSATTLENETAYKHLPAVCSHGRGHGPRPVNDPILKQATNVPELLCLPPDDEL